MLRFFVILLLICCKLPLYSKLIDLEANSDEFILDTKQIVISEYPDAFNPSIIRYNNSILMIFRIRDSILNTTNQMGLVWLDENFNPYSKVYLLEIRSTMKGKSMAQDPRLILNGDDLYIVYNDTLGSLYKDVRRMVVAALHFADDTFYIENPTMLTLFDHELWNRHQKNWAPFIYNGKLFLTYSINPHTIFNPIIAEERCESVASTISKSNWDFGELRGGSQCFLVGCEYLGFFHSSKEMPTLQSNGKKITHYFMGAYTFDQNPPFAITSVSETPIIGKNFYNGITHKTWKPLRVVFPGGYIFDNEYIWVSYGRQDHEIWIVKMEREKLLNSLKRL